MQNFVVSDKNGLGKLRRYPIDENTIKGFNMEFNKFIDRKGSCWIIHYQELPLVGCPASYDLLITLCFTKLIRERTSGAPLQSQITKESF